MSAFGYGSSYMPSWRGNTQAINNSQSPTFNIAPEAPRPNFNPVASNPIDNLDVQSAIDKRISYADWANPLDSVNQLYSSINGPLGSKGMTPNQLSQNVYYNQDGVPYIDNAKFDLGNQGQMPTKGDVLGNQRTSKFTWDTTSPGNSSASPKDLYNQVSNLSLDQLQRLSSKIPQIGQAFGSAAQGYSNAYANPWYAANAAGNRGEGQAYYNDYWKNTPQMGKSSTMDYLQKAYDVTMKQLDKAYLL